MRKQKKMELSTSVPEASAISIQSTIIQTRSFPTISSQATTIVDTFANQNEGSGYICRYAKVSREANICN